MCSIKGCDAPILAKGLCAKHYMRQRKHGKTDIVEKRGRKPFEFKAMQRQLMMQTDWSQSTFERFWLAFRILHSCGASAQERKRVIENAARPNGSLNISKLVRDAWTLYFDKKD
jgi:hypothetical protein